MDPSLPVARALAIAGDTIAGGVGTHELALASPERVDLGGRCVLPGFNDAHVHFPTWSLAQRQVRLEGTRSLEEALERIAVAAREAEPGRWLRGLGWRSGDWSPPEEPTKEALDRVTGGTPTALMARDYHSLWLNTAALAQANGDLEAEGGVVERDERGEPTGVLREECAWRFRDTHVRPTEDEMVEASRAGMKIANARGVTAVHDKDGWLGALGVFQRLQAEGSLSLRVWESHPRDELDALLALPLHGAFGNDLLRLGYVKAFMDGTLGSQTAHLLDGSGVEITSRVELEETIVVAADRRAAGLARGATPDTRAGPDRHVCQPRLARGGRETAGQARPRLPRRPGRPRPRPVRARTGGIALRPSGRDDARRALGLQPATVGLTPLASFPKLPGHDDDEGQHADKACKCQGAAKPDVMSDRTDDGSTSFLDTSSPLRSRRPSR